MSRAAGFSKSISGFDPRSIAGCCLWLDGADSRTINSGVSITNGTQVTSWKDKSIFSNHATPVSNATIPVYWNTNTIGGLPAIYMCNAPQFRGAFSTRLTGSNISVFTVAYTSATMPNALGHDQRLVSLTSNNTTSIDYSDTTGFMALDNQNTLGNLTSYYNYPTVQSVSSNQGQVTNYSTLVTSNVFLASVVAGNAVVNAWYNGLLFPVTGGIGPAVNALNIGNYGVGGGSYPTAEAWFGGIGEVLVYSNALSTSERQAVEGYLSWKWSIVVSGSSPGSIPGLILWLDGNDSSSITFSSGTTVSQWRDKSGFSNHATTNVTPAANVLTGPTYNSTTKAMLFTAASTTGLRGNIAITYSNIATVFVVATYTSNAVTPANPRLFALGCNTTSEVQFVGQLTLISQLASGPFINDYIQYTSQPGYNSSTGFGGNYATSIPISYSTPFIYSSRSVITTATNGITVNTFLNGSSSIYSALNATSLSAAGYTSNYNRYSVGNVLYYNGGPNSDSYNGNVYEVLVYSNALTISQINSVNAYLSKKWKISVAATIGLPVNHSFYNIRPFTRIFQPYDIGSPFLWFDAADRRTIVGTSAVTSWTSKGSVTAVAGSAVGAPVSGTYRQNGLNTIFFPANSSLRYTVAQPNQARAWFAVYQTAQVTLNTSPGLTQYYSLINQTTGNGQQGIGGPGSPTNTGTASYSIGIGASGIATYVNTVVASNGANAHSVYAIVNSAVSTNLNFITQNGNSLTLNINALATSYQTSSATYTIGDGFPYGNFSYIAEILCYNYEITVPQRQLIEGYLAHKWGLTTPFPAAHPYKKFPPLSAIPFLPTNFSSCALWLDAADPDGTGLTPANGSVISTWRDKSRNAYTGTSSGSPTLVTRSQNGLPCVNFVAASSQYFNFGNIIPLITAGITVFAVGKTTFGASAQSLIAKSRAAGFNGRWGLLYESPNLQFLIDVTGSGVLATASATTYSGVFSLFGGAWSSPTAFLYANGTQIGSVSASGTPSSISDSLFVGAYPSASGGTPPTSGYYFNGTIGEIIVYNAILSTEQRQKVEGYLACKWGLRSSLISTNPYKLYEPVQEGFLIVAAPGTPTGLTATNTTSTLNMSWTTGSGGTPATFTVTVYTGATLVATQTISYPTTSSTFSPMTSSVAYTFYVSATNTGGTSATAGPSNSVTYTPSQTTLITTVGAGNVVFGAGGTTLIIECWGGGGGSMGQDSQTGAGAGGAYSKTTVTVSASGFTLFYSIGAGGVGSSSSGAAGGSTWARVNVNAQPSSVTDGALAVGGNGSGVAGPNNSTQLAASIGQTKYIGGAGGFNGPENGGGGSASSLGNGTSATGGTGTAGGAAGTGGGAGGSAGGFSNSGGDGISNVEGGGGGGGSYNNQGGMGGLPGGAGGMGWSSGGVPTSGVNTNPHGFGGNGGRGQIRYARS